MLDTLMQSGSNQVSGAMLDTLFVCALYKTRKPREDREVIFCFCFLGADNSTHGGLQLGEHRLAGPLLGDDHAQANTGEYCDKDRDGDPGNDASGYLLVGVGHQEQPRTPRLLPTAKSRMFLASSVAGASLGLGRVEHVAASLHEPSSVRLVPASMM